MKIKGTSRTLNMMHGSTQAYIYREMVMGREALFMKWAEGLGKLDKFDIIIRAHIHVFMHIHQNRQHIVVIPAWQAFTPSRYTMKSYGKLQPDIGACLLLIDENDRIHIWHYLLKENPKITDYMKEG